MTRKAKYSAEEKLSILNELSHSSVKEVTRKYSIGERTILHWQLLYKYQGIDGLRSSHHNCSYSKDFKQDLVQRYQKSADSLEMFAIKNGLKSETQLSNWIIQYNGSKLKANTPRKRDSIMPGRKTTFEELKVVMTRNHFVIGGVKPSRRKHGRKLID